MAQSRVTVLGAYRVDASDGLWAEAMELKYPAEFESENERVAAGKAVRDELGGAVLFEVVVDHRDPRFSMDDFGQGGSDQAPYHETFLSEDGETVILLIKSRTGIRARQTRIPNARSSATDLDIGIRPTENSYRPSSVFNRARVACSVDRGTVHSFFAFLAFESIVRS